VRAPGSHKLANDLHAPGISNVFAKDSNGWTPLHTAANEGNLNLVESLLSTQAVDVTVQNSDGNTALHYFVRQWPENSEPHCEKLLQMFVWRGASLNAANRYAETPLHSCCVRKNLVALKALLQSSANPNAKTKCVLSDCVRSDICVVLTPCHYYDSLQGQLDVRALRRALELSRDAASAARVSCRPGSHAHHRRQGP